MKTEDDEETEREVGKTFGKPPQVEAIQQDEEGASIQGTLINDAAAN